MPIGVLSSKVQYNEMPTSKPHTIRKYITPIYMNKLKGRMLNMPKLKQTSKIDFLVIYGQKSTIEKWTNLLQELRNYGNVTMPDLPGMGGMQSFYKINDTPTIENYADYLAAFIKLRFSRKKIVIIGMSFGFVVVTRMLQKYPELTKKVELVINLSGFTHRNDLKLTSMQRKNIRLYSKLFSYHSTSKAYRGIMFEDFIFKKTYERRRKIDKSISPRERSKIIKEDYKIQKKNDSRTHMFILGEILKLNLAEESIDLPVWSLVGKYDEYLDSEIVKSHLESIYYKYHEIKLKKTTHKVENNAMTPEYMAQAVPYKLKQLFNRLNKRK